MRVISWNVNSIRTRLDRLVALLERHQPDLLCLQETKVVDDIFPHAAIEALGYKATVFGQKTYNGVAMIAKQDLAEVTRGFPGNPIPEEARVIGAKVDGVEVLNLYVVNGQALDSPKFETKLLWIDTLLGWLEETRSPDQPLLLVGDFNITPDDRDVHDPVAWSGKIHASKPERQRLQRMEAWGLTDLHRRLTDEEGIFTWWDYRNGAFHRGWGLRIDLAYGSKPIAASLKAVTVDRNERKTSSGEGKPSDHAPLIVDF